eukprot:ANDGO_00488.mRNA.1 hypothetical protein DFA_03968
MPVRLSNPLDISLSFRPALARVSPDETCAFLSRETTGVIVRGLRDHFSPSFQASPAAIPEPVMVYPACSIERFDSDVVTSCQWIAVRTSAASPAPPLGGSGGAGAGSQKIREAMIVLVGFESGTLRAFNITGDVLMEIVLHIGPIRNISVNVEDALILYKNTVVRLDLLMLSEFLRRKLKLAVSGSAKDDRLVELQAVEKFIVARYHIKGFETIRGVVSFRIPYSVTQIDFSFEPQYALFCYGQSPCFSLVFPKAAASSAAGASMATAVTVATEVASKLVSFAKGFWSSSGASSSSLSSPHPQTPDRNSHSDASYINATEKGPGAVTLTGMLSVSDEGRQLEMSWSPSSSPAHWILAADSLGRVLLIDVVSCTVSRIFKGYRDAQCCWFGDSTFGIYAPRRGLVDVFSVDGDRLSSSKVPCYGGFLLPGGLLVHEEGRLWKLSYENDAVSSNSGTVLVPASILSQSFEETLHAKEQYLSPANWMQYKTVISELEGAVRTVAHFSSLQSVVNRVISVLQDELDFLEDSLDPSKPSDVVDYDSDEENAFVEHRLESRATRDVLRRTWIFLLSRKTLYKSYAHFFVDSSEVNARTEDLLGTARTMGELMTLWIAQFTKMKRFQSYGPLLLRTLTDCLSAHQPLTVGFSQFLASFTVMPAAEDYIFSLSLRDPLLLASILSGILSSSEDTGVERIHLAMDTLLLDPSTAARFWATFVACPSFWVDLKVSTFSKLARVVDRYIEQAEGFLDTLFASLQSQDSSSPRSATFWSSILGYALMQWLRHWSTSRVSTTVQFTDQLAEKEVAKIVLGSPVIDTLSQLHEKVLSVLSGQLAVPLETVFDVGAIFVPAHSHMLSRLVSEWPLARWIAFSLYHMRSGVSFSSSDRLPALWKAVALIHHGLAFQCMYHVATEFGFSFFVTDVVFFSDRSPAFWALKELPLQILDGFWKFTCSAQLRNCAAKTGHERRSVATLEVLDAISQFLLRLIRLQLLREKGSQHGPLFLEEENRSIVYKDEESLVVFNVNKFKNEMAAHAPKVRWNIVLLRALYAFVQCVRVGFRYNAPFSLVANCFDADLHGVPADLSSSFSLVYSEELLAAQREFLAFVATAESDDITATDTDMCAHLFKELFSLSTHLPPSMSATEGESLLRFAFFEKLRASLDGHHFHVASELLDASTFPIEDAELSLFAVRKAILGYLFYKSGVRQKLALDSRVDYEVKSWLQDAFRKVAEEKEDISEVKDLRWNDVEFLLQSLNRMVSRHVRDAAQSARMKMEIRRFLDILALI